MSSIILSQKKMIQFNFKKPESSHWFLLYKVHAKWESGIKSLLKDFNLTHPQFIVLTTTAWFVTFQSPPTQKELSEKTGIDSMTISIIIRGLLKKSYIEREDDKIDTRSYRILLTAAGAKLVQESMNAVDIYDKGFFSVLSQDDKGKALDLFRELLPSEKPVM